MGALYTQTCINAHQINMQSHELGRTAILSLVMKCPPNELFQIQDSTKWAPYTHLPLLYNKLPIFFSFLIFIRFFFFIF